MHVGIPFVSQTPDPSDLPRDALPGAAPPGVQGGDKRNVDANAQWGGRFAAGPSVVMQEINASIGFDRKMWRQDISGSLAHAAMLAKLGIISAADEAAIRSGLAAIAADIESGKFPFDEALEDIHMNIEARLAERIG